MSLTSSTNQLTCVWAAFRSSCAVRPAAWRTQCCCWDVVCRPDHGAADSKTTTHTHTHTHTTLLTQHIRSHATVTWRNSTGSMCLPMWKRFFDANDIACNNYWIEKIFRNFWIFFRIFNECWQI